jgi:hypothetical protein
MKAEKIIYRGRDLSISILQIVALQGISAEKKKGHATDINETVFL